MHNNQGRKMVSNKEFDLLQLIEEVKEHPLLYSKDIKVSKDSRERSWEQIAYNMEFPVHIVKTKWRSLKDSLSRLKRDKSRSCKKTWYMLKHLTFLPFVDELLNEQNKSQEHVDLNSQQVSRNSTNYTEEEEDVYEENDDATKSSSAHLNVKTEYSNSVYEEEIQIISNDDLIECDFDVENSHTDHEYILQQADDSLPAAKMQKVTYKTIAPKPENSNSNRKMRVLPVANVQQPEAAPQIYHITQNDLAAMAVDGCIQIYDNAAAVPVSHPTLRSPTQLRKKPKLSNITSSPADDSKRHHLLMSKFLEKLNDDEFSYGMHIAQQLRSIPAYERDVLRNKIDNLIFTTKMAISSDAIVQFKPSEDDDEEERGGDEEEEEVVLPVEVNLD